MKLSKAWSYLLAEEMEKPYFKELKDFVENEYKVGEVYPTYDNIFAALDGIDPSNINVIIVGQDPYHEPEQANGLAFSVKEGTTIPPSLKNILTEVRNDTGASVPNNGDLTRWKNQGVLLLNSTLTVRRGLPGSHLNKGWEQFTGKIIEIIASKSNPKVFMLWGSKAQEAATIIKSAGNEYNLILWASHPSPFSADKGFFKSRHFTKANSYLRWHKKYPINW